MILGKSASLQSQASAPRLLAVLERGATDRFNYARRISHPSLESKLRFAIAP